MSIGASSITLGIVTRNRAELLPVALSSALSQEVARLQLCVFDDGSTDTTPSLARSYPTVLWRRRDVPEGYMSARNELMTTTNSDYYVSLDDDAWFLDGDEIGVAVDYLEKNDGVGAVAFDILSPDRPNRVARKPAQEAAMFIGCGHVLRLSAVRLIGMYESTPGSYGGEEKDLCLRLMDAGFKIALLPGVHVWHAKSAIARDGVEQHTSGVCNDLVMAFRRTPAFLVPFAMLAKFYRHFIFSWRHGFALACLRGFLLFARSLPLAISTRRPVRATTLRNFVRLAKANE